MIRALQSSFKLLARPFVDATMLDLVKVSCKVHFGLQSFVAESFNRWCRERKLVVVVRVEVLTRFA